MKKYLFNQKELNSIAKAVKAAEKGTSGEIVVCFTPESDDYEETYWRGFVLFSYAIFLPALLVRLSTDLWIVDLVSVILLAIFFGGLGVFAVTLTPSLKRFLAGELILDRRVDDQAAIAFMEEEVFNTRDRTGILIFLSLFERRVRIIGDIHINSKVKVKEWEGIIQTVVNGMLSGKAHQGLIHAIFQCGDLLRMRGIKRPSEDINELPNKVKLGDHE